MGKIKICWLTESCFLDTDMPLLPILAKRSDIKWIVLRRNNSWYSEQEKRHTNFYNLNQISYTLCV